jgi:Rod binding domain-containing protein
MSGFLPPVGAFASGPQNIAPHGAEQNNGESQAAAFSSVFLQGMLKEIFKNQWNSGILDDNINNSLYAEMLTDEMIKQLAESDVFGLNELVGESIDGKIRPELSGRD